MTQPTDQSSREREAFTPFGQGTRRFTVYANPRTDIRADLEQWLANWKRNYGDEATSWLLEQAFQDFEAVIDGGLREAVRAMAAALSRKEWAEHVSSDADATALECEITKLMGSALSGSAESGEARLLQDENSGREGRRYNEWHASRPDARLNAREAAAALLGITAEEAGREGDGWQPIETAPADALLVVFWLDAEDPDTPERHAFDWLEDGVWQRHADDHEHFLMCAPPGSRGPSEKAPYTHWMPLPPAPAQSGGQGNG